MNWNKVKLIGYKDETFTRICTVCKENQHCNFCKFIPNDRKKHKHRFNIISTTYSPKSWLAKLFGAKDTIIEKQCVCGEKE